MAAGFRRSLKAREATLCMSALCDNRINTRAYRQRQRAADQIDLSRFSAPSHAASARRYRRRLAVSRERGIR
jgi:hypothetical protein